MTSFADSSGRRVPFQASTYFLMGSQLRCRSTPTVRVSTRLRFSVCLASTGVNKLKKAKKLAGTKTLKQIELDSF